MMVDTLTIARELKAAELPAAQAEAIAAAIGRSIAESSATKADIDNQRILLRGDIEAVKHELRGEIEATKHELRTKIEATKHELRGEIERVRIEVKRARNQLLTWIMSAMVALAGLIVAVVKL